MKEYSNVGSYEIIVLLIKILNMTEAKMQQDIKFDWLPKSIEKQFMNL
jgi:hypothetical protein